MHALSVSLLRAKQLPVITNGLGASPHAGSTCTIGVVTVRPLNRLPARLYFKLKPDPNNTFFFIFTCTTQYPWVLANLNLSQAMAPSKKKRIHTVFRDSSAHRSASTSKPRFVGEKVRVSDAFDLRMGKTPSRKNPAYWRDGGHDWVSIADLGSFGKYVGVTKERINDLAISESGIKPAPANTVLMSFKLSLGKTSITTEPVYTNEAIMAFVDKGVYPVDASFMYHQCRAKDWTAGTNTAVMGKTLNKKTLGQAYVHLPALEVQKMIAARLDFIDEQIRASKSSADKLEHLVKSRFVEMFGELDTNPKGFQLTCFDDLGTWTSGGTPSRKNPSYFTGEIDWYSAGELNSLHLGRSKERISLRAIEESSAKLVPPGSLFVGMYDTAALKMGITTKESSSNQACANLVPNGIVDLVWLYFAIDQLKPSLLAKRSGCRQKTLA